MTNIDGVSINLTYSSGSENLNNTFLNFSYNNESVGSSSELIRKWYYQAYVNDTNGDAVVANVSAYNSLGVLEFSVMTNSSGWTSLQEITDYVNAGGTKNYYSDYIINATNSSYPARWTSYNVSLYENKLDNVFTLDNVFPLIDYTMGTAENNTNLAQSYIYVNVTVVEDYEEDTISFRLYNDSGEVNSSSFSNLAREITWVDLSDGVYTYNVSVNDTAGNENSTTTRTITLDNEIPLINILYPLEEVYDINVSQFNYTVNEEGSCWYSVDGGETNSSSVTSGINWTGLSGVNDENTWTIFCNDSSGNENSTSITFYSSYIVNCTTLTQSNYTYTLHDNLTTTATCLNISASNISVDGNGYSITGDNGASDYGVANIGNLVNLSVKNIGNLSNFSRGISFVGVQNSLIKNNTLSSVVGVYIESGINNSVINNSKEVGDLDYRINDSVLGVYDFRNNSLEILNSNGVLRFLNESLYASGTNLSEDIVITDNNIFVNSSAVQGFNTTANVTLNGLSVAVAEAIVDFDDDGIFEDCPLDVCNSLSFDGTIFVFNVTHFTSYSSEEFNTAPDEPDVFLNSSGSENITSENLLCNAIISDPDRDDLNVSVKWYLNGTLNQTINYSSQENGTLLSAVLDSGNTTKHQNWSCGMRFNDEQDYTVWVNSSNLTILNAAPVVTLTSPVNDLFTTNRIPTFSWTATDADGDDLTYTINISKIAGATSTCVDLDRVVDVEDNLNYVPVTNLNCLVDNGDYYIWKVRANDGEVDGDWADERNVSIKSSILVSLDVSDIYFGALGVSNSSNTDDGLAPFVIQNDGTVLLNISVNATALWDTQSESSDYYQFKVDNVSGEEGAFDWLGSVVDWINMPLTGYVVAVNELGYEDSLDSAEIDINITVPEGEGPGIKNSTVVFAAALGE